MPADATAQHQMNFIQYLLFTGGLPWVAFGIVFSIWGFINIVRVPNYGWIFAQAWMSFLPGIIAIIGIYATYLRFAAMATSTDVVDPAEFAAVAGAGMSFGFLGIVSTIVPLMLSLAAFHRYCRKNPAIVSKEYSLPRGIAHE